MIFIGAQNKSLQLIVIAAILSYAAGQFVIQAFFDGEGDASLSASVPVPIDQNCTTNKHKHSFKKTCRLGERVNGDYVLNHFKENHVYATDTNASVTVAYPKYEPGNLVTCVELKVFQNNPMTNYSIVSGGLGQRAMILQFECTGTKYLNFDAIFYGL